MEQIRDLNQNEPVIIVSDYNDYRKSDINGKEARFCSYLASTTDAYREGYRYKVWVGTKLYTVYDIKRVSTNQYPLY